MRRELPEPRFSLGPAHGAVRRARVWLWALVLVLLAPGAWAQEPDWDATALPASLYTSGEDVLRAFKPISEATRNAVVKFNIDGETVALGAVLDPSGLALTKASQLRKGKLTCWLASEKEVPAEVLAVDDDEDVALVKVHALGLKPIEWTTQEVTVGQWAVTPGIASTPQAVGIISALPRHIQPRRAFIGIRFDVRTPAPRVDEVLEGFGAQQAGLKPGDLILAVNGTVVTNRDEVVDMLREFRAGQSVHLRIRRAQSEFTTEVQLMSPHSEASAGWFHSEAEPSRLSGEVSERAGGFERAIEHDTVLQPWLCGGPLVDLEGKGIGLNIARADRVTTYALPASLVRRLVEQRKAKAGQ